MTDSMPMGPTASIVPEPLRIVIEDLWRLSMHSEERIYRSSAFRVLEDTCRSVYLRIAESRLGRPPSIKVTPSVLSQALRNLFRWNGAPWFGDPPPDAGPTAASLHRAFLRRTIQRTYLVPLDRLFLEDPSSGRRHEVTSVRFGPNEIVRLQRDELAQRVPINALARFGPRYRFPTAELDGFCWLVTSQTENAGTLEKRTWLDLLNTGLTEVDTVMLFRSTHPTPVENALFVLLLILLKDPRDIPWQPFRVPWTFSFLLIHEAQQGCRDATYEPSRFPVAVPYPSPHRATPAYVVVTSSDLDTSRNKASVSGLSWISRFSFTDDLFSDPVAPPNPSALSHDIVGDEHDHFEVPDKSEVFDLGDRRREALQDRWNDLETVLARAATDRANFHPLTRHFFVKALSEHGVDEIISNLSCLEATLQLKREPAYP